MLTPHIKTRQYLKDLPMRANIADLLSEINIDETDMKIMHMKYLEHKQFDYIADILGYSQSAVERRHKKVLSKISKII